MRAPDSLEKFNAIVGLCQRLGVYTEPFRVGQGQRAVWLVPLYSWYRTAEADRHSCSLPKREDWENSYWMDKYYCSWPDELISDCGAIADYFLSLNSEAIARIYDAPILSFSHFLPRKELIFDDPELAVHFCEADAVIPSYPRTPRRLSTSREWLAAASSMSRSGNWGLSCTSTVTSTINAIDR